MIVIMAAVILILIGLYGVAAKRNLVKVAIGLMLTQYAADLLLIALAEKTGAREWFSQLAALAGLATTIVLVALVKKGGTSDVDKLSKLKG